MEDRRPFNSHFSVQTAIVGDNKDPLGLQRVRLQLSGFEQLTQWAFPATVGGGSANRGIYSVPEKGSSALVWFHEGDPNLGMYYMGGWWGETADNGKPMTAKVVAEAIAEDGPEGGTKIDAWTSSKFEFALDRREGKERIFLRSSELSTDPNDNGALLIELDANTGQLSMCAPSNIIMRTRGQFIVDAGCGIVFNGRAVDPIAEGAI